MPTLDKICYECRTSIDDLYYLTTVDHNWHLSCLKCFDCGISLEHKQTCFTRYGQIFCKDDYIKRYCSPICTRCDTIIQPDEIILRAEHFIFHLNCFTCFTCHVLLHSGDEFGLKDDHIFCRDHFFEQQMYNSHVVLDDSGYYTSPNETRKRKEEEEEEFVTLPTDYYYTKQKRLRTSFKHNQLRCMRSYFNLNHNPDAKDLKNLSEKTNLPKRVLQVWFQNARAKYRRSNTSYQQSSMNEREYLTNSSSPTESIADNLSESETCL